jgi:hypothetical protein
MRFYSDEIPDDIIEAAFEAIHFAVTADDVSPTLETLDHWRAARPCIERVANGFPALVCQGSTESVAVIDFGPFRVVA